jgi:metal-dependent HD superfamily phosphatase/phosphodiesterase
MKLNIPTKGNKKLERILAKMRKNKRLETLLECSNIIAIDRLGINDHGLTHIAIVSNIALKLLRNLMNSGTETSIEKDYSLTKEDAEVVVVLAAVLHDIGHVVHRDDHTKFSITLAIPLLSEFLTEIYNEREATIITAEVLHAIAAHHKAYKPLTVEAGVLCIADALDMKGGRARIPFEAGIVTIHAVSALAIEDVEISSGQKPIMINIKMSNSSGIFQIDNLLKPKLKNSGLEEYVQITAEIKGEEKKILESFEL